MASGLGVQLAGPTDVGLVAATMVLLGLGWNGSFVAVSSLLASAATPGDRPRVQGVVDATAATALGMAAGRPLKRHVGRARVARGAPTEG